MAEAMTLLRPPLKAGETLGMTIILPVVVMVVYTLEEAVVEGLEWLRGTQARSLTAIPVHHIPIMTPMPAHHREEDNLLYMKKIRESQME